MDSEKCSGQGVSEVFFLCHKFVTAEQGKPAFCD